MRLNEAEKLAIEAMYKQKLSIKKISEALRKDHKDISKYLQSLGYDTFPRSRTEGISVVQKDMKGKFIAFHNSYTDAVRAISDVTDKKTIYRMANHISEAVRGKRLSAYGFQWN